MLPVVSELTITAGERPQTRALDGAATATGNFTVRSESRCALRLRYVDLVVSIEVAVEVCCCFTVFSC
jgi:hypothetical protein